MMLKVMDQTFSAVDMSICVLFKLWETFGKRTECVSV